MSKKNQFILTTELTELELMSLLDDVDYRITKIKSLIGSENELPPAMEIVKNTSFIFTQEENETLAVRAKAACIAYGNLLLKHIADKVYVTDLNTLRNHILDLKKSLK
jgi:hypothetical protein